MEKKAAETQQARLNAEKYSDQILTMEGWLRQQLCGDRGNLLNTLKMLYGDEFDDDDEGLREL